MGCLVLGEGLQCYLGPSGQALGQLDVGLLGQRLLGNFGCPLISSEALTLLWLVAIGLAAPTC